MPVFVPAGIATGSQSIAVSTTVKGLTVPPAADYGLVQVLTANVRYTIDGSAPSATHGLQGVPGDAVEVVLLANLQAFQVIREGAVDGALEVVYFVVTPETFHYFDTLVDELSVKGRQP